MIGGNSDTLDESSALTRRIVVGDEEYASNQARLSQLQALLNSWVATNEQGHIEYLRLQDEMSEIVEAGEAAKKVLAGLREAATSKSVVMGHLSSATPSSQPSNHGSSNASIAELRNLSPLPRQLDTQPNTKASSRTNFQGSQRSWVNYTPPAAVPPHSLDQQILPKVSRKASRIQNQTPSNTNELFQWQQPPTLQDQQLQQQFQRQHQLRQQQRNAALYSGNHPTYHQPHAHPSQQWTQQDSRPVVAPAVPHSTTSSLAGALGDSELQHGRGDNTNHTPVKQGAAQHTFETPKTVPEMQGNFVRTVNPRQLTLSNTAKPPMSANVTRSPHSTAKPGSQPVATSHIQSTTQSFTTPSTSTLSAAMSSSNATIASAAITPPPSRPDHHGVGFLPKPNNPLHQSGVRPDIPAPSTNISKQQAATFIHSWSRSVPPSSYLKVPDTNYFFYKDDAGRVHVLAAEKGETIPPGVPPSATTSNSFHIDKDNHGNYYYSNQPPTTAHPQSNRSETNAPQRPAQFNDNNSTPAISIPTHPSLSMQPIHYIPTPVQNKPAASWRTPVMAMPALPYPVWSPLPMTSHPRTPAQADKTRLAKDILRSLGPPVGKGKGKRPYDEVQPESVRERGLKRQHLETEDPALSADLAQLDTNVISTPTPVRMLEDNSPVSELGIQDTQSLGGDEESHQQALELLPDVAVSEERKQDQNILPATLTPPSSEHIPADEIPRTSVTLTLDTSPQLQHHGLLPNRVSNLNPASTPPDMTPHSNIATLLEEVIEISDDDGENEPTKTRERHSTPPLPTLHQSPPTENEDSSTQPSKEPLFLPSPTSSPSRLSIVAGVDTEDADDHVMIVDDEPLTLVSPSEAHADGIDSMLGRHHSEGQVEASIALQSNKAGRKRQQFYVLVPPLPEWARQGRKRTRREEKGSRRQRGNRGDENGTDDVVERGTRWEDFGRTMEEIRPIDPAETKVLEQTYLGLRQRQCKWKACDIVLNSTERLSKHIVRHIEIGKSSGFDCLWAQCTRRFSDRPTMERHLENHAKSPILCAFIDCDETFRRPKDLVRHNDDHKQNQHKGTHLRPLVTPFKPQVPSSLGRVPRILPAHLVEPRYVRNPGMSIDRHVLLGEWVLRNILGPIEVGSKRSGAVPTSGYYEYDFLASKSRSPTKLPQLDDLQSAAVSELIHAGVVFWGPGDSQDDDWDLVTTNVEYDSPNQDDPELHEPEATVADVTPKVHQDNMEQDVLELDRPQETLADESHKNIWLGDGATGASVATAAEKEPQENVQGDDLGLRGPEATSGDPAPKTFGGNVDEDVRSTTEEEVVELMLSL